MISLHSVLSTHKWAFASAALCFLGCVSLGETPPETTTSGGRSSEGCVGWADGVCDIQGGETCECVDCEKTAYCKWAAGGGQVCIESKNPCGPQDGICDPVVDYCACEDCWADPYCQDPDQSNCTNDDGCCDAYLEGCLCTDCRPTAYCLGISGATVCLSGSLSGTCEEGEDCACLDCVLEPRCACSNDDICEVAEPCACQDCKGDASCSTAVSTGGAAGAAGAAGSGGEAGASGTGASAGAGGTGGSG